LRTNSLLSIISISKQIKNITKNSPGNELDPVPKN
jgi:hypothetical protein